MSYKLIKIVKRKDLSESALNYINGVYHDGIFIYKINNNEISNELDICLMEMNIPSKDEVVIK
jgi:hypothetical protein